MPQEVADAPLRRDPRTERSRAALREALAAMLAETQLEDISCLAVAKKAGVGYATFYRNYAGLDALLADLAGQLIGELARMTHSEGGGERSDRDIAQTITAFVDQRRALLSPLLTGANGRLQRDVMDHALAAAKPAKAGQDQTIPAELAMSHRVCAMLNVLRWWLEQGHGYSAGEVGLFVERLCFR